MPDQTERSSEYDASYEALYQAISDPGLRGAADADPVLSKVLTKLSDRDLQTIRAVVFGRMSTNHGDPLTT